MDLTPKQQASEAIKAAENIMITAGQNPSIDQVAATMALAMILRKLGKKVSAVVSDPLPGQVGFLPVGQIDKNLQGLRDFVLKVDLAQAEVDKLKYTIEGGKLNIFVTPFKGGFGPDDVTYTYGDYQYDLVVILGVPNRSRADRAYTQNPNLFSHIPIVNIDFHRINENYGAINLIDGQASSLCEMLAALADSLESGLINEDIATVLLTGIIASTDRFTATHTTAKSLTLSAQLIAAGARHQQIVKALYRSDRRDDRSRDAKRQEPVKPKPEPVQKSVEGSEERSVREESETLAPRSALQNPGSVLADDPEPMEYDAIDLPERIRQRLNSLDR
jgi:nanoRNase/pAp phosphatase (c-di-AMP/oligoRNAs hydrolase)